MNEMSGEGGLPSQVIFETIVMKGDRPEKRKLDLEMSIRILVKSLLAGLVTETNEEYSDGMKNALPYEGLKGDLTWITGMDGFFG